jgi:hypothetical protein
LSGGEKQRVALGKQFINFYLRAVVAKNQTGQKMAYPILKFYSTFESPIRTEFAGNPMHFWYPLVIGYMGHGRKKIPKAYEQNTDLAPECTSTRLRITENFVDQGKVLRLRFTRNIASINA